MQIQRLTGLMSGDWALLADTIAQDAVYIFTEASEKFAEVGELATCPTVENLLEATAKVEELAKSAVAGNESDDAAESSDEAVDSGETQFNTDKDWDEWDSSEQGDDPLAIAE